MSEDKMTLDKMTEYKMIEYKITVKITEDIMTEQNDVRLNDSKNDWR